MVRKDLGYIELQWTCPNCGGKNRGPDKVCSQCGAPQPADVKFEQAERQDLITAEEVKEAAEAGADIHCPFCGTRNPAKAKVCSQCGGDLVEGKRRESGQVVGAFSTGPVTQIQCPRCGSENPDTAKICSQCGASLVMEPEIQAPTPSPGEARPFMKIGAPLIAVAILLIVCAAIAVIAIMATRTESVTGTVESVRWERIIPIEALVPVYYNAWQDQIPSTAEIEECHQEIRYVQDEPAPNSVEVCGTPYNVDTGSGYAQVVQDCEYQVYDQFCSYSVEEWRQVDAASVNGTGYNPVWPELSLQADQREGSNRGENYVIIFSSGEDTYTYTTSDYTLFQAAQPGSTWNLQVNSLGSLVSVEP